MKITVKYMAQLKQSAGVGDEIIDIDNEDTLEKVVRRIASNHSEAFRRILLDADMGLQPAILYFVGDEQLQPGSERRFRDGETLTVLAPMAGG